MSLDDNSLLSIARQMMVDAVGRTAGLDHSTWAQNFIGYEHHEVHSGSHYFLCDYALGVANDATINIVVAVPDTTKWPHLTIDFSGSEGATLELYKGANTIVGGTPIVPVNNNGNSSNTSGMTIIKDPTSLNDGTRVAGWLAGGGRTSGFNQREREVIGEQAAVYLFRITSLGVGNDIGYCFEWYEHTNKE